MSPRAGKSGAKEGDCTEDCRGSPRAWSERSELEEGEGRKGQQERWKVGFGCVITAPRLLLKGPRRIQIGFTKSSVVRRQNQGEARPGGELGVHGSLVED